MVICSPEDNNVHTAKQERLSEISELLWPVMPNRGRCTPQLGSGQPTSDCKLQNLCLQDWECSSERKIKKNKVKK